MKWWYVLFVILGLGIGWWILKNYGTEKTQPGLVAEKTVIKEMVAAYPTKIVKDDKGEILQTMEIVGTVKNWSPDTGILSFVSEEKEWELTLDPLQSTIFIPSLKNKEQQLIVKDKDSLRWKSAFCVGDFVSFKLIGDKVTFVDNAGYRSCGFKGE